MVTTTTIHQEEEEQNSSRTKDIYIKKIRIKSVISVYNNNNNGIKTAMKKLRFKEDSN